LGGPCLYFALLCTCIPSYPGDCAPPCFPTRRSSDLGKSPGGGGDAVRRGGFHPAGGPRCRGSSHICIQGVLRGAGKRPGRSSNRRMIFWRYHFMTKADLTAQVAANTDMTKKDADKAVNAVFEALSRALANGEKVTISGFGTFEVRERAERQGINPRTQEPITIAASRS